jgi:predicted GIY-YIG superfamily endonuclease
MFTEKEAATNFEVLMKQKYERNQELRLIQKQREKARPDPHLMKVDFKEYNAKNVN